MDLGFHLAMSYRNLKHPTSRNNFADVVGQNHALILTQCLTLNFKIVFSSSPKVHFESSIDFSGGRHSESGGRT